MHYRVKMKELGTGVSVAVQLLKRSRNPEVFFHKKTHQKSREKDKGVLETRIYVGEYTMN